MISARFAPAVSVLVGLALVPTIIHDYAGSTIVDGRDTSAIATTLGSYTSSPSGRNSTWGKRRFDSDDWIERLYESTGNKVRLTVVRSFDLKALYHHPELAVAYGTTFTRNEVKRLPAHPDVPVWVLSTDGEESLAMYALQYDDRFVENPILFQLRTSGELLISGRKAMTLFFVTDASGRSTSGSNTSPAATVLFSAIDSFNGVGSHLLRTLP